MKTDTKPRKRQVAVRLSPELLKVIGDDRAKIVKTTSIRVSLSDVIRRALEKHYGLAP